MIIFADDLPTTRAFQSPDQLLQHEDFGQTGGVTVPMAGNIWTNERKPKVKPRKKDLFEPKLMLLLGSDFDSRWMKKTRELEDIKMGDDEFIERKSIRTLRALVNSSSDSGISLEEQLSLPQTLPPEYREIVKNWLIGRGSCPVKFKWYDLGDLWYPRWISKGECMGSSCSWPPGMICAPSGTKVLYILRWHCRKKKSKKRKKVDESIISNELSDEKSKLRRFRQRHKCAWLKVPFPVPDDCACSCKP
ncbi:hypothetical protein M8J77_025143 [Diaphorina citri]|nr:hypothetical protein M8J77_025143 [Diaphorina citri]